MMDMEDEDIIMGILEEAMRPVGDGESDEELEDYRIEDDIIIDLLRVLVSKRGRVVVTTIRNNE